MERRRVLLYGKSLLLGVVATSFEQRENLGVLQQAGLTVAEVEEMYRYMAIANYEDRFVIPTTHREYATAAFDMRGSCGFSFGNGCSDATAEESSVSGTVLKSNMPKWCGTSVVIHASRQSWRASAKVIRESAVVGAMELGDDRGVLIKSVAADSLAAELKMPTDAVIVAANDKGVANVAELAAIVRAAKRRPVRLKIMTARGYVELSVTAGKELPVPR